MTQARLKRVRCGAALCAALLFIPSAFAGGIDADLQAVLDRMGPSDRASVIVRFVDGAATKTSQIARGTREEGRAQMVRELRARSQASLTSIAPLLVDPSVSRRVELWAIDGLAVTASADVIRALAVQPNVERVSIDAVVREPIAKAAIAAVPEWNLGAIRAPELWVAGHTGFGVVVATMDSGVDVDHQDLATRYRGGDNSWFDPYGEHATPHDTTGHGTQALGLIVGGDAGGTAIGVAPGATWIAARIFDDSGNATLSGIHECFQWLLDPDDDAETDDAPDVVNGSWDLANTGSCNLEFEQDLQVLRAAGIAVAFSAGNYGPYAATSASPGNNPTSFAVGAVDENGGVASFSASGPSACDGTSYPNVVAPGVTVRTADKTFGGAFPDSYVSVSGTSFAAPHLAGAMALLLGAHPGASVTAVEQALERTAVDVGAAGPDFRSGHGLTDVVVAEAALGRLVVAGAVGGTTYTNEGDFLAALGGAAMVTEGFEDDGAWGGTRFPDTQPSVVSQSVTWTSNHSANEISTSGGAAFSGNWGLYSDPHGDQAVPNPADFIHDGVLGRSSQPLVAVGAWVSSTHGGDLVVILDGDEANPFSLGPVGVTHQFYGVVVDHSFTTFELREIEGTLEDQKFIFVDDVTLAMADGAAPVMDGVVAGVANFPGQQGSEWHSDLYLHNSGAGQATVELYLGLAGGTVGDPETVAVGPGQTLAVEDVVATLFAAEGSGAIFWRVAAGDATGLLVNANTYNRVDAEKRYGQQIPGVRWSDAAAPGTRVLVPAVAGRYRSNLGFATDGSCTMVVVRGYDRTGALVAEQVLEVQPWSWMQVNSLFRQAFPDLLADPDSTALADSIHRFEVTGIDGRVVAYTSIIDNSTNDSSYMLGQVPGGADVQWLPGAAVIQGDNQSDWRSDVVAMSTAATTASAEVSFFPADQDNRGTPDQRSIPMAIGESVVASNILAELFAYSPPVVGSLQTTMSGAAPLLWMRTYTEEPDGGGGSVTYGQAILPRRPSDLAPAGGSAVIFGFSHDASTRANLILQNTRAAADGTRLPSEVLVELLAADGSLLHEQTYSLLAGEYRQHNRFVDDYGTGAVEHASLRVTVLDQGAIGETGGVDAMVSEINGNTNAGTNDGRLIRATALPAE
jgi:bacillopeptidase F